MREEGVVRTGVNPDPTVLVNETLLFRASPLLACGKVRPVSAGLLICQEKPKIQTFI